MSRWLQTLGTQMQQRGKTVVYLSAEYLLGRQLDNALLATELEDVAEASLESLGLDLADAARAGGRAGPGQRRPGPAGRLLRWTRWPRWQIPAVGYGIRYEYGIFQPDVRGRLAGRAARPVARARQPVGVPATRETAVARRLRRAHRAVAGEDGTPRAAGCRASRCSACPLQLLVPGYRDRTVNTLRLWSARATRSLRPPDLQRRRLRRGGPGSRRSRRTSRKVLYPEDSTPQPARSCASSSSTSSSPARCATSSRPPLPAGFDLRRLPERATIQLNDTHPVIAIPELMRILIDENGLGLGHGLGRSPSADVQLHLPHAAARGAGDVVGRRARPAAAAPPGDHLRDQRRASWRAARALPGRRAARAPACRSSRRSPSAASAWPTSRSSAATASTASPSCTRQLLRDRVLRDFAALWPERFTNVTNGVTPRRFLRLANPRLSELITEAIGDGWLTDLERLRGLEPFADDAAFRERFRRGQGRPTSSAWPACCWPATARAAHRRDVRRDDQAAARVQAPAAQGAAHRHALPTASGPATCAATSSSRGRSSSAPRRRPATGWPSRSSG